MGQLHELLAVEKTLTGSWNTLYDETLKKLGNEHFFSGHSKALKMLAEGAANEAIEQQNTEHKAVPTNVHDTLEYMFDIYAEYENLQYRKNRTNAVARGSVEFEGEVIFPDLPVDELLGLEARLTKIRALFVAMPTLDASKLWAKDEQQGAHIWAAMPEYAVKTEKVMVPVVMAEATDKHPAQVKESVRDYVIGKFMTLKRSGAVTAVQKSNAIRQVDALIVEVKRARMRANETPAVTDRFGDKLVALLMEPLK
jgi:hypothetical protein